jgi:hypothetical protein
MVSSNDPERPTVALILKLVVVRGTLFDEPLDSPVLQNVPAHP